MFGAKKENYHWLQKMKHFIAPHLSLFWTSCHKSHLSSKERGHKDENWKATHPTPCPKVPKSAQVLKIAKVLLGQKMFRLLVGCWRPTSNWGPPSHPQATPLLSLPPPSASLIHGSLHGNQPTSHPTPEMKQQSILISFAPSLQSVLYFPSVLQLSSRLCLLFQTSNVSSRRFHAYAAKSKPTSKAYNLHSNTCQLSEMFK